MTTIAVRAGVIAADSLIAYTHHTNGERPKIAKMGRYFVALAGKAWLRRPLEQWVAEGCNETVVPKVLLDNEADFSCLMVDGGGGIWTFDAGYVIPICSEYTAIGSAGMLALGAMATGATAEQAVAAAAKHDKNTGGVIHAFHYSTLN